MDVAAIARRDRPFVGRVDELVRLDGCLDGALAGRTGLTLISGEPGIGKTRLAAELAERAAARGFAVHWGRCWEDAGAPAYWLWIQILRASHADTSHLGDPAVAVLYPSLAGLLPELEMTGHDAAAGGRDTLLPSPLESERSRFRLFEAVSRYLRHMASLRPVLLVLDDIHSADLPSLLLLQFLARTHTPAPLVIVATQREAEVRLDPRRADIFAILERRAERITLRGWQNAEVARFLEHVLGAHPGDGVVTTITNATAGNPLFVDGFAQQLRRHSDGDSVVLPTILPDSIRTTIHQRLAPLPPPCRDVLAIAAVGGQHVDARMLARVAEMPLALVLGHLDAARRLDLVSAPDLTSDTYAFAHPLIRQTVYSDVPPADRMDLHRRWASTLEERYADRLDVHAGEIAHHFFEAATEEDLARAIDYAERAAARSASSCAYEQSAQLYERALTALAGDERRRCELLVALAESCLRAGQTMRAREVSATAAHLARQLGAAALHARAALFFGGVVIGVGIPDPELLQLLDDSLSMLGENDDELRAIVSARLAVRLHLPSDGARRVALSQQALEFARRVGSPEALAYALDAQHMARWESTDIDGQLAIADELIRAARACGNRELVLHGIHLRIADHLEAGAIDAADREIAHYESLTDEVRQTHYTFRACALRAMRAMMQGEFERAERLAAEAENFANQAQSPLSIAFSAAFALAFDRVRGRLGTAETIARPLVEALPTIAGIRLGLAALYADLGRRDEAAAYFASSATVDFADVPRDNNWLLTMSLAAELCAYLGDVPLAAKLFPRLEPFVDRQAVGASGWTTLGSMARPLGLLARTLGRREQAIELLERALASHRRMRAHAFVVHAQLDLAETVGSDPHDADERRRVEELANAALAQARALGMDRHIARAEALLSSDMAMPPVIDDCALLREGEYWSIRFAGRTCRLKEVRGLHYLARLLAAPGAELHCLDLVTAGATRLSDQVAAPLLDDRARSAYRLRLQDLRAEVEDAEEGHDLGRAERARQELEALEGELSRAFGLGGRSRNSGTPAERARVTVTKSIRLALDRLDPHHPPLAEHLRATLRTGTWCAYVPDPRSPLRWRLD